jgi:hypothetical protein
MRIAPDVYEEERRRVASRFDEAVRLAEQAFASEFAKLLTHLTERLGNDDNGDRRVFRDSAIGNLSEFFQRFKHLNINSNAELDGLVEQAQRLVQGISPQSLRDNDSLRRQISQNMSRVQRDVESLLVDAPRRRIIRARPGVNGRSAAARDRKARSLVCTAKPSTWQAGIASHPPSQSCRTGRAGPLAG